MNLQYPHGTPSIEYFEFVYIFLIGNFFCGKREEDAREHAEISAVD